MSDLQKIINELREKQDALIQQVNAIPESRMGDMALFGQREMPIRAMFYQLVAHDVEHTVHAAKTLRDIGKAPTEAQLILGLLQEAEARLEALLVGLSDQDIDTSVDGEWSIRQVLEHVINAKSNYGARLAQALE
jgi:hypothetical protein